MNIFVTSSDFSVCAQSLDDKRLVKMVLETAQLLTSAHNILGGRGEGIYKTTHQNHPCAIWVRSSWGNYSWTYHHFRALCSEYTKRFGKIHACQRYEEVLGYGPGEIGLAGKRRTRFVNCTPYKDIADIHEAYRRTLNDKWDEDIVNNRPARWTNASAPKWRTS